MLIMTFQPLGSYLWRLSINGMSFPEIYVSKPGVCFPEERFDNAKVIDRILENYRGDAKAWPNLKAAVERVFEKCNTQVRYLDFDPGSRLAGYAAKAARQCLAANHVSLDEVDLVIFGGIAREYFEPATAMEVSSLLGLKEVHAFDVTTACVGHLEAIQVASGYLAIHPEYRTALVCTAELARDFLSFDVQSTADLHDKAAGLTIGNAASCVLVRRTPFKDGSVRLVSMDTFSLPAHWHLCQVPIKGTFTSSSTALMKLHSKIAPRLKTVFKKLGWKPGDVDHFVFHQPSETMTKKILKRIGADPARGIYTHHLYGNNASATVGVVFEQLLKERVLQAGDKLMFGSAASGFTMGVAAGKWVC